MKIQLDGPDEYRGVPCPTHADAWVFAGICVFVIVVVGAIALGIFI